MKKITLAILTALFIFVGCTTTNMTSDDDNDLGQNNEPIEVNLFAEEDLAGGYEVKASTTGAEVALRFENNVWEYIARVEKPTPCDVVSEEILVAESFPEQVTFSFEVLPPPNGEVCAQVIDVEELTGTVEVDEGATFATTFIVR